MLRLTAAAVALVAIASPAAISQTGVPAGAGQGAAPSAQTSDTGVPSQPGNQNGPAARPPSTTSGANASPSSDSEGVREEDAAKNPALPGTESGAAAEPQPESTGR